MRGLYCERVRPALMPRISLLLSLSPPAEAIVRRPVRTSVNTSIRFWLGIESQLEHYRQVTHREEWYAERSFSGRNLCSNDWRHRHSGECSNEHCQTWSTVGTSDLLQREPNNRANTGIQQPYKLLQAERAEFCALAGESLRRRSPHFAVEITEDKVLA
jgi:hypothetical protein